MDIDPVILNHIFTHMPLLLNRDFLLDILTVSEKNKANLISDNIAMVEQECYLYEGKFLDIDGQLYVVSEFNGVVLSSKQEVPVTSLGLPTSQILCEKNSPILLPPNICQNYIGDKPLETTMGRLLLNYTILVDPFGTLIPYINELWNIGKIESTYIFDALRNEIITVDQIKHYSRNLHFIGHFTELAVPSFTERSLTVNPELIKRRNELLKKYSKEINAGDVVTMAKIEEELVAMDREFLKGDSSTPFYDYDGNKSYGTHRKKMYGLGGITPGFGEDKVNFVDSSLEEGWDVKDFPALCNQIRDGSYSRAKETAKGGEETKFLIRVFQNTQITEDDCGSNDYIHVQLTKDNSSKFLYRNILENDKLIILTNDNINSYIGKTLSMRSPMHCHTKNGYCYTCMGELFRTIGTDLLTMAAIDVGKAFVISALKKMHLVETKRLSINSLNSFVI